MTDNQIRAALKQKWMDNDHDIDVAKMVAWSGRTREDLIAVIRQYERELISTKFNLVEK